MNKLGNWPNSELHFMIGDITWSLKNGVGEVVFQSIDQAKVVAWENELYRQVIVLLELERQACFDILKGKSRQVRILKIISEHRKAQEFIEEEVLLYSLRAEYYDPHIDDLSGVKGFPSNVAKKVAGLLSAKFPDGANGGLAKLELNTLRIAVSIVLNDFESAKRHADEIGAILKARPWLGYADENRQLRLQWLRIGVYVLTGEKDELEKLIHSFQVGLTVGNPNFETRILYKLWSLFLYYERFGDDFPSEVALVGLKQSWDLLIGIPPSNLHVWPIFFGAKSALDKGDLEFALHALRWLLNNKRLLTEHLLLHCRIMELLCFVGKTIDFDTIRSSAASCLQFLSRHPGHPGYLTAVANSIAIATKQMPHNQIEANKVIDRAIEEMNTYSQKDQEGSRRIASWLRFCWSNTIKN
jgi:hypothetical protein